jgi:hypothetical protein
MISTKENAPLPSQEKLLEIQEKLVFHKYDYLPNIPGMASEAYANELARYIHSSSLTDHELRKELAVTLSDRDRLRAPEKFFGILHRAEASIRQVTPWTMDRVLHMQEQLYEDGYFTGTNFIEQRTLLFSYLDATEDPQRVSHEKIGQRVCGMELCLSDFWALNQVDAWQANHFLQDVQKYLGGDAYWINILGQTAHFEEVHLSPQTLQNLQDRLSKDYSDLRFSTFRRIEAESPEIIQETEALQKEAAEQAGQRVLPGTSRLWRRIRSILS